MDRSLSTAAAAEPVQSEMPVPSRPTGSAAQPVSMNSPGLGTLLPAGGNSITSCGLQGTIAKRNGTSTHCQPQAVCA